MREPKTPQLNSECGLADSPSVEWHHTDRIEPGAYFAYCRACQTYFDDHWHRWVCAIQFDILDDSRANVIARLTKFLNLGEFEKPRATSRRSNFWRAWVDANDGRPPRRGQKVTGKIFLRRFARVEIGDVEKDFKQISLRQSEVYSVVRKILCWETGTGSTTM